MYGTLPLSGPGDGIFPPSVQHLKIRNATAATAFIAGGVGMLDIAQSRVTNVTPGHSTSGANDSIFGNAILPTTAGIAAGYPLVVFEEAIAAGAVGKATLMSPGIRTKVTIAASDIALGAPLVAANAADGLITGVAGIVGWAAHSVSIGSVTATGSSTTAINVIFNGVGPRA